MQSRKEFYMNDNLEILADYCCNQNSKNKLTEIWYKEVKELLDNKKVDLIYEIYDEGFMGAWYYIITKNNMKYIVRHKLNNVNTKMMMDALVYQKRTIKINSELLNIIYNYNKLTTHNKPDGSSFKVLAINNRYALIEEKSNNFCIYIIVQNGVSPTSLQFANLISAVNMYYKDFAA